MKVVDLFLYLLIPSTMMGHSFSNTLHQFKIYFQDYVGLPYLVVVCLFYCTFSPSAYWLPTMLVAKILAKLGWRVGKPKFVSQQLQRIIKRLLSKSLEKKTVISGNIRNELIGTRFDEDHFDLFPTPQQAALILIKLKEYALALSLFTELESAEKKEDEKVSIVKALANHLQGSQPPSNDAKVANNNLEKLLIDISHNKLKPDDSYKDQRLPKQWIQDFTNYASTGRCTPSLLQTSKQIKIASNDKIIPHSHQSLYIPQGSLPLFFNLFGKGVDAPVISRRGLVNLGNTCYMNSGLQCLHKSFELTSRIKQSQLAPSPFVRAYLQLMEELSKDAAVPFRPREVKALIGKYNDLFADHAQHDAGELMSTVLTHLSEELNTVATRKIYKIDASVAWTDDELLGEYIKKDRHRSHSLIEDLFFGRFLTVYQCLQCHNRLRLFQKFSVLFLPMPIQGETDLQSCMREFLVPDRLVGSNAWWCSKCQSDTPTDKSMSVYQHSPFLAICLKRFNGNRKITGLVKFDQQLTLHPISHRPSVQQLRYDLYGVINHVGSSLDHGHYFSFCLDGNIWRRYDDESVSEVSPRDLVTPNAFVLLYRLRK